MRSEQAEVSAKSSREMVHGHHHPIVQGQLISCTEHVERITTVKNLRSHVIVR